MGKKTRVEHYWPPRFLSAFFDLGRFYGTYRKGLRVTGLGTPHPPIPHFLDPEIDVFTGVTEKAPAFCVFPRCFLGRFHVAYRKGPRVFFLLVFYYYGS